MNPLARLCSTRGCTATRSVRLTLTNADMNTIMAGLDSERELCHEDSDTAQWEYDRIDTVENKIHAARRRMDTKL